VKNANKTQPTAASVNAFVSSIKDPVRRREVRKVMTLLRRATKARPRMWGSSIIGFGSYYYKYGSGREGEWCITGLSPRKDSLTVYILPGLHHQAANLKQLGNVTTGRSCVYIKRLDDIRLPILEKMARQAMRDITKYTKRTGST
jgi:hypothetical protein